MRIQNGKKGFTLVELMVVVGIIAIILTFAIPNFITARKRAQASTCVNNLKLLYEAGQLYRIDEGDSVSSLNVETLYNVGYLDSEVECPIGGAYAAWDVDNIPVCSIGTQATEVAWDDHVYSRETGQATGASVDWLKFIQTG